MSRRSDDLTAATFMRGLTLGAILGAIIAGSSIWSRHLRRRRDLVPREAEADRPG